MPADKEVTDTIETASIEVHDGIFDAIVVGGGAAGIGVAISLMHAGIENFVVVKHCRNHSH